MTTTLEQIEGIPANYPPVVVSTEAAPFVDVAWQRVETYIAFRTTVRSIEWIVEGCGTWNPPLKPVDITSVEKWTGTEWEATMLDPSPLGGFFLTGVGPYRFTGTAGDDVADVPDLITEAVRRLAEYMAKLSFANVGQSSFTAQDVGSVTWSERNWRARALQESGAADLLRSYRRA